MTIAQPPRCFTKTVKDRCHVCYTCVRGCPAKAIRILDRQAEIVADRCIGCGNCVRVCGRGAKKVVNTVPEVEALLASGERVAALVAPSFSAEFYDLVDSQDPQVLVGMLRQLGFSLVTEVGFGADLVAQRYRTLLDAHAPGQRFIATTCPAVVGYVERYWPQLVQHLAPIVSPMVAMARVLRQLHGPELRIVFIGPCLAKKVEASSTELAGEVDAVITFGELRSMLAERAIDAARVESSDFDPPHAGTGMLFPLNRGLFQAAAISEDLASTDAVAAHGGPASFVNAIEEFAGGDVDFGLVEVLCCNGCIWGPGMTTREKMFRRRARVAKYANESKRRRDAGDWHDQLARFAALDLVARLRAVRPAQRDALGGGDPPHPARLRQGDRGGRAQLQGLRLRHLPRARYRHLPRPGRNPDVPALRHRALRPHRARSSRIRTANSRARRSSSCTPSGWPAWVSWRPASPTSSTIRSGSCCSTRTSCATRPARTPTCARS